MESHQHKKAHKEPTQETETALESDLKICVRFKLQSEVSPLHCRVSSFSLCSIIVIFYLHWVSGIIEALDNSYVVSWKPRISFFRPRSSWLSMSLV